MPELFPLLDLAIFAILCLFAFIGAMGIITYTFGILLGITLALKAPHSIDLEWMRDIMESKDEDRIKAAVFSWSPILGRITYALNHVLLGLLRRVTFTKE